MSVQRTEVTAHFLMRKLLQFILEFLAVENAECYVIYCTDAAD